MPKINVIVQNKIASAAGPVYICGNSDYTVAFSFDAEWTEYETKTARFVYAGGYIDVVFTGSECAMPIISDTNAILIGVFAGNLHTTTAAKIPAQKSILCGCGSPAKPPEDVYAQIMETLNTIEKDVASKEPKFDVLPVAKGGTDGANVYQAARRLGRTTYNYSGNASDDIVIDLANFPCVYGCELYVCMKNGNTKADVNLSVNGTNLPVYDSKTGAKLTGKEINPYQMCTFQLAEACGNLPKRWVLMNSVGTDTNNDAIQKIELADGEKMDIIDLPQASIVTGNGELYWAVKYPPIYVSENDILLVLNNSRMVERANSEGDPYEHKEYQFTVIESDGGVKNFYEAMVFETDANGNGDYVLRDFYITTSIGNIISKHDDLEEWARPLRDDSYPINTIYDYIDYITLPNYVGEYVGELGALNTQNKERIVDAINEVNEKVENEPNYELITRQTFDEIDMLNGSVPEGKTSAWREKTIKFGKKYKTLFYMLYFDVQDDLSATRDCIAILNGDKGGTCYLGISKVMTNTEKRYVRCKVERKNGLWWLEYTEPVAAKGNMATLRTTQTGFGFAAERIDAEDGIVDATHLSSTENITSLTFQTTMPSNGTNGRQNPKGAIAIFGIPAN